MTASRDAARRRRDGRGGAAARDGWATMFARGVTDANGCVIRCARGRGSVDE